MTARNNTINNESLWQLYRRYQKSVLAIGELSDLTPDDCWNHGLLKLVSDQQSQVFKDMLEIFTTLDEKLK